MKVYGVVFAMVFLTVSLAAAQSRQPIAPKSVYSHIGAMVSSPNEAGWSEMRANKLGVAFGRQYGTKNETAMAATIINDVEGFEKDKDFLDYIATQREKQLDTKRFKVVSITNEQVRFKDAACLKYEALSEDHKDKGIESAEFQYLKTAGYVCRHPAKKIAAIQMEISYRSQKKTFPPELITVGEEFFNNVHFTAEGLK